MSPTPSFLSFISVKYFKMIDSYDLAGFYGRGTVLHTGLEYAYQQFDHDLKRKGLLILYSNGLSQSEAGFQDFSKSSL